MLPGTIRVIQRLARRPRQPVTIQQLIARSAAVTDEQHINHARWCRDEFPVRLAHQLADFMRLPFLVVCNVRFAEVFRLFLHAFESLAEHEEVRDLAAVHRFATNLRQLVRGHDQIVSMMQEGYSEVQDLLDGRADLDDFLTKTFFTRIGNRVLAEHFLTVHEARLRGDFGITGIVHTGCCPADLVRDLAASLGTLCNELYGMEPTVRIEGETDTKMSFVADHLGFMLQEILKNAMRATVERHGHSGEPLPPVVVEIIKGSFDVTIKVSDAGGGMKAAQLSKIWRYGYTSTREAGGYEGGGGLLSQLCGQDESSLRQMAGYGFGLPLSRVYAQYFGGDIHVQSMAGCGTDVYLNINCLGDIHEESSPTQRGRLVAC